MFRLEKGGGIFGYKTAVQLEEALDRIHPEFLTPNRIAFAYQELLVTVAEDKSLAILVD